MINYKYICIYMYVCREGRFVINCKTKYDFITKFQNVFLFVTFYKNYFILNYVSLGIRLELIYEYLLEFCFTFGAYSLFFYICVIIKLFLLTLKTFFLVLIHFDKICF